MGFAFPKEEREALVASEPEKFLMPPTSDLRYHWVDVRLDALDADELQEIVVDAWRMVVPKSVAAAYDQTFGIASEPTLGVPYGPHGAGLPLSRDQRAAGPAGDRARRGLDRARSPSAAAPGAAASAATRRSTPCSSSTSARRSSPSRPGAASASPPERPADAPRLWWAPCRVTPTSSSSSTRCSPPS